VSALIDDDTNWWKRSLVEEIFIADEVERICRMVISLNKQVDQLVWVGNKNGNFSIKSAYHLERHRIEMEGGSSSLPLGDVVLWKALWRLKATRAIIMFTWKACSNILPTKENLLI
jgi:hypothetical protein